MLNLKKVLTAKPKAHEKQDLTPLLTPWGEALDVTCVLPEHPHPEAQRNTWASLNGAWTCAFTAAAEGVAAEQPFPEGACTTPIVVPFSPEAPLSGVNRQLQPHELLWYQHTFDAPSVPAGWRVVLHFEAVDYTCTVWLNGQLLGTHKGGYTPFSFDITDTLRNGENQLRLRVSDPSETGTQLRGKQRLSRGDIWYTAQSGIWQSVWLEWMPAQHVGAFSLNAQFDHLAQQGRLTVESAVDLEISVIDAQGNTVAAGTSATPLVLENTHPWSPDDPYLYTVELHCGQDVVRSYCGFRTVAMGRDAAGHRRLFLNGQPIFLKGVLDQGYWPDGLLTAPSDEALIFDIQTMKSAGFNMLRKHIKVESARWYYHCDRLGMLVWQDMVSGGDVWNTWHVSYKPTLFMASWDRYADTSATHQKNLLAGDAAFQQEWLRTMKTTIDLLKCHPSIITWVLFNEGWGQFDAARATEMARAYDPTRPIDAVSGWYDQHCGDFKSVHNYFRPLQVWPDRGSRAFVVSEFGGLTLACSGHTSLADAYGYDTFQDQAAWSAAVRDQLAQMEALEPQGLAGYVYTQVSDVEEEVNGLMTYDRRVVKLEP